MELHARIYGKKSHYFLRELFTNSAHFPLGNIFFEWLREGPTYFLEFDLYAIAFASLVQAYFLSKWQQLDYNRWFLGNLIGPAIYTAVEIAIEGTAFFSKANHLAYWGFALGIGIFQTLRHRTSGTQNQIFTILENVTRSSILLALYWILEAALDVENSTIAGFVSDPSHVFVIITIPVLGIIIGFADWAASRNMNILQQTAVQLKGYSEWLLGKELLSRAITDPSVLTLQRQQRAVLFMDIRGFTSWSEDKSPEAVVEMLNDYFETAANAGISINHGAIKVKLTGDEVMAVFPNVRQAVQMASQAQEAVQRILSPHGLSAGIGIHTGALVEGILGNHDVRGYDVLGDTVNTAKRLCDNAAGGEILVSDTTYEAVKQYVTINGQREISAKGKRNRLTVYTLNHIATPESA